MAPTGPLIWMFIFFCVGVAVVMAATVHRLVDRFWLACGIITSIVLVCCAAFHGIAGYSDAESILMLYGIGGGLGLTIAILTGLPFATKRRAKNPNVRSRVGAGLLLIFAALVVLMLQQSGMLRGTPFYNEMPGAPLMLFGWIPLGLIGVWAIATDALSGRSREEK